MAFKLIPYTNHNNYEIKNKMREEKRIKPSLMLDSASVNSI